MTGYGPPGQPDDPYQRPPAGPPQPPTPGAGYPLPPTSGAGYPPHGGQGGYPPPGPFPPAGPTAGPPAAGGQWAAPPPIGYGMPPAALPANKGGKIALIIALVVLLLVCPCLGVAGWAVWRLADDERTGAAPSVSAPGLPPEERDAEPSAAAPTPRDEDDEFAKGDCVVNDGTDDEAELRKVPCGPNTYEVLVRIPATTDGDRCRTQVPEATVHYVHDNTIDRFDFVLCLREYE